MKNVLKMNCRLKEIAQEFKAGRNRKTFLLGGPKICSDFVL